MINRGSDGGDGAVADKRAGRPDGVSDVSDVIDVVIVDDEELFRTGLRMVLETAGDIRVVEVCEADGVLKAVAAHSPDVVLLDIRMPQRDGLAVLEDLKGRIPTPAVVMLTSFSADAYVVRALRAGADGFLLKDSDPADLIRAVRAAAVGGGLLSPSVGAAVVEGYAASLEARTPPGPDPDPESADERHGRREAALPSPDASGRNGTAGAGGAGGVAGADQQSASHELRRRMARLTAREHEVLALLGTGLSNPEIAEQLGITPGTAKEHVSATLAKLGTDNRVRAAVIAYQAGLVGGPRPTPVRDGGTPPGPAR
ncbi:response regulator transcription factor [Streptomyces sp. NPDC046465]|uniref:response regulator transcription factor n=1 Tax=Streptomyces sp. NPDC046465 TaxID=3155810 RepID=UPI0033E32E6A